MVGQEHDRIAVRRHLYGPGHHTLGVERPPPGRLRVAPHPPPPAAGDRPGSMPPAPRRPRRRGGPARRRRTARHAGRGRRATRPATTSRRRGAARRDVVTERRRPRAGVQHIPAASGPAPSPVNFVAGAAPEPRRPRGTRRPPTGSCGTRRAGDRPRAPGPRPRAAAAGRFRRAVDPDLGRGAHHSHVAPAEAAQPGPAPRELERAPRPRRSRSIGWPGRTTPGRPDRPRGRRPRPRPAAHRPAPRRAGPAPRPRRQAGARRRDHGGATTGSGSWRSPDRGHGEADPVPRRQHGVGRAPAARRGRSRCARPDASPRATRWDRRRRDRWRWPPTPRDDRTGPGRRGTRSSGLGSPSR